MKASMAKRRRAYNARVKVWRGGKCCAFIPHKAATQCHHQRGRIGSLLMDERFWIPICAEGHAWIDANREEARKTVALLQDGRHLLLLCAPGEWNTPVL